MAPPERGVTLARAIIYLLGMTPLPLHTNRRRHFSRFLSHTITVMAVSILALASASAQTLQFSFSFEDSGTSVTSGPGGALGAGITLNTLHFAGAEKYTRQPS